MSGWTHSICDECWEQWHPEKNPVRIKGAELETCCFCGMKTDGGVYIRADPKDTPYCKHED